MSGMVNEIAAGVGEAIRALERFVVDNDELLELEERIGRFNIFDALRIVDREVKHSDFLAWLLDPNESHGQGGLFLRTILMDLFKTSRENGFSCPVSPIELDGEDLHGVEVRREWKNTDLLIRCGQPTFVIAIENKIKSGEHSDQLNRYRRTVEGEFGTTPSMYVFLTIEGDAPSEDNWVPYSYGDIHRVLSRVRNANESSIGDDVLAFLDHYLRLLRGRLMDDPDIDGLCQTIYRNHRQAIELIIDRVGAARDQVLAAARSVVDEDIRWRFVNAQGRLFNFAAPVLSAVLPPISRWNVGEPEEWICFTIGYPDEFSDRIRLWAYIAETSDPALRRRTVMQLTQSDGLEFSIPAKTQRGLEKGANLPEWVEILREDLLRWDRGVLPDSTVVEKAVRTALDRLGDRVAGVPDALRPILEEWRKSQPAAAQR
jgi:hypothetical protein